MVEQLLCTRRTRVQIPAPALYEITFLNSTHVVPIPAKVPVGKKLLKPPWEGFSKNHCRDYLKCLPCLNSSLHCNKHNLQLSALSYLMIWEQKIQLFKIKRWSLRGRVSKAYYYSRGFGASVYSYQYWPSELSFLWKLAVPLFSLYLFCQLATIIQDTKTRNQTIASWFTFLLKNSTI